MTRQPLTDVKIRKTRATDGARLEIWDAQIPGFGVRITPSGNKSFVLLYRLHGRSRRMTLKRYPVMTLAEARMRANEALAQVANGHNPQKEQDAKRNDPYQFEEMVNLFVRLHCQRMNRENTAHETARLLAKRFVILWGRRDIREITKGDVLTVLDTIVDQGFPSAANHAFAAIRKFFSWCVERDYLDVSPCLGVKSPTKAVARARVLTDEELAKIWASAKLEGYPFGSIVQLLILTGQRRNEIAGMRWSDLNLSERIWTLPPERNKSAREHVIPLTEMAVEIIRSIRPQSELLVFPSRKSPERTFSGFSKCKKRVDGYCGVAEWTLHDIRRTVATGMAQLGISPHVVERVLNHSSGTFAGVAGVYNRFGYLDEMRDALTRWEGKVKELTNVGDMADDRVMGK